MIGGLVVWALRPAIRVVRAVAADVDYFRAARRALLDEHQDRYEEPAMANVIINPRDTPYPPSANGYPPARERRGRQ